MSTTQNFFISLIKKLVCICRGVTGFGCGLVWGQDVCYVFFLLFLYPLNPNMYEAGSSMHIFFIMQPHTVMPQKPNIHVILCPDIFSFLFCSRWHISVWLSPILGWPIIPIVGNRDLGENPLSFLKLTETFWPQYNLKSQKWDYLRKYEWVPLPPRLQTLHISVL